MLYKKIPPVKKHLQRIDLNGQCNS
ncbi:hypothetical protein SShM2_083 [Synechococcus phage S-ShM2]|uniref:Uncharacterized protein n=1 Tax=Synechococcus phage S-ShM2 TaxID=445683 RepID=E3SJY4_9CAUD|nr:hypothetical protein SShM2_083 [Synechococcus phage S-ShM2]ADO97694.1 hypothetical protein SShM2_083 [Synechococcus phage S-ShM2]